MLGHAVLSAFLGSPAVEAERFLLSLTLGASVAADGGPHTPRHSNTAASRLAGYRFDVLCEKWEDAPFYPRWMESTKAIDDAVNELTERFGVDALLEARLLRRTEQGLEHNPFLKPGRLWIHYNERHEIHQLSTERGVLLPSRNSDGWIHDIDGLRRPGPSSETLSVTFSPYEALALRCMGMRAVSILFPRRWDADLFEHFLLLLRVERISRLVFWPFRLGGTWSPLPEQLTWLEILAAAAPGHGIEVAVMTLSRMGPQTPNDAVLQNLMYQYVKTAGLNFSPESHPLPFQTAPDMIRTILSDTIPYAQWAEQLPERLRRPGHWTSLKYIPLPDMLRAQSVGSSFLLRARIRNAGPLYVDSRAVSWFCRKAKPGRQQCWACRAGAEASTRCSIDVPRAFLLGLDARDAEGRRKQLKKILLRECRCDKDPVRGFHDARPWRKCSVLETVEFSERPGVRETLLVDSDTPLLRDQEYDFEVAAEVSAQSGQLVLIANHVYPCLSAAERYRPYGPELGQLERFVVGESPTKEAIADRIEQQVSVWLREIGQVGADMPQLVRWIWLLYATPFCLPDVRGLSRGGAASMFVLGNSSQAKGFPIDGVLRKLEMGRSVDSGALSKTGLLAAPESDRSITLGDMPEQDRGLLVLDEAHCLDRGIWQALRKPRRDGVYYYSKMATGRLHTRTRLVCVANPPDRSRPLSSYAYPWEAAPYLNGPDVSRFDLFMTVRAEGGMPPVTPPTVDYTSDLLRALVAHNWAKAYDQQTTWHISDDARSAVEQVAIQLTSDYGLDTFPLYRGTHVGAMVLSWATAAANLAPCKIDRGIWVEAGHVQYVHDLLKANADSIGLGNAVAAAKQATGGAAPGDVESLVSEIRKDERRTAIAKAFETADKLTTAELAKRAGLNAETMRKTHLPWFAANGLLTTSQGGDGGVAVTRSFRELLSRLGR